MCACMHTCVCVGDVRRERVSGKHTYAFFSSKETKRRAEDGRRAGRGRKSRPASWVREKYLPRPPRCRAGCSTHSNATGRKKHQAVTRVRATRASRERGGSSAGPRAGARVPGRSTSARRSSAAPGTAAARSRTPGAWCTAAAGPAGPRADEGPRANLARARWKWSPSSPRACVDAARKVSARPRRTDDERGFAEESAAACEGAVADRNGVVDAVVVVVFTGVIFFSEVRFRES